MHDSRQLRSEMRVLPPHRRGVTLLELVVVITCLTFLLGIIAMVTHTLFRAQRSTRAEIGFRRTASRLSLQFRRDGHAALAAELGSNAGSDDQSRLTLILSPERKVQYRFQAEPAEVQRIAFELDTAVSREAFELPRHSQAQFGTGGPGQPRVLVLTVTQPVASEATGELRTLRIETAVGFNRQSTEPLQDEREASR